MIGLFGSLGEFDLAKSHYEKGLTVSADNLNLHQNFGVLMLREKNYTAAIPAFRAAIAADPTYSSAHKYLGMSLQALNKPDEALESFQTAVTHDRLDHEAKYLLAQLLFAKGDLSQAIEVLENALEPVTAKTPSYLKALATTYAADGKADRAHETFLRARTMAEGYGQTSLITEIDKELASLQTDPEVP